jgi:hypothetical protein
MVQAQTFPSAEREELSSGLWCPSNHVAIEVSFIID